MTIHESAIVDKTAKIGKGVTIGPWSHIGPNVSIGEGTTIASHVVIKEDTTLGKQNKVHAFVSLGGDPQTKQYKGEKTALIIGDYNVFHEYCTINRGDVDGVRCTRIGDYNLFMTSTHVAHDCVVGNHVIMVNHAVLAGHVVVDDYAVLGAFVAVHQFCRLGESCFLTKGCLITKDVLPYGIVTDNPPKVRGLNRVGLQRRQFTQESMQMLKTVYKQICSDGVLIADVIEQLAGQVTTSPVLAPIHDMLSTSKRGIIR